MLETSILEKAFLLPKEKLRNFAKLLAHDALEKDEKDKLMDDLRVHCNEADAEYIITMFIELTILSKRKTPDEFNVIIDGKNNTKLVQMFDAVAALRKNELDINWKLDLSVPEAKAVLYNLKKGDDTARFRLDMSQFHKLRFNVALLLKELNAMKKSSSRIKCA